MTTATSKKTPATSKATKPTTPARRNYSPDEIRDGAINNAMGRLEDIVEPLGIGLEYSGTNRTPEPRLCVSGWLDDKVKFKFTGDTDRDLIAGAKKLVSQFIRKFTQFEAQLAELQPAPLPEGLWITRDAKGKFVQESLYPWATVTKGCTQTFEPLPTPEPSVPKPARRKLAAKPERVRGAK